MKFIVTTSFSAILVDSESGEQRFIDRGRGLYYGIAFHQDLIFIAARNRLVSSELPVAMERGEILVFDKRFNVVDRLSAPFPLRDIHEIAWHAGKLWVSCSYENMVAIFDGESWSQWYPLGKPVEEPFDRNHFNSFFFEHGNVCLAAHNIGESELLFFDMKMFNLTDRIAMGKQIHNIWREDGQLFTCSSAEGRIIGDRGFSFETGGFPRGMILSQFLRCVGISELAERKDRDFTTGILRFYNSEWRFLREMYLHGEGLILDIRQLLV